jgi:hypothetical protein
MIRAKSIPSIETASGIPIDLQVTTSASGSLTREGVEIEQELRRPQTADLVVGARLYHRIDQQFYEIVGRTDTIFMIKRVRDETQHGATLRQLKACMYVYTERSAEGVG